MKFRIKKIKYVVFLIFVSALFTFTCTEREISNIFDPRWDKDSLDIKLRISSADSVITVKWSAPRTVDYKGFNLYRKVEGETEFSLLGFLPEDQTEYDDHIEQYDITYQYYLTIQGENSESPPTKKIQTIPGPVSFWVLDKWGFNILNLTYDLNHVIYSKYGVWMPENLCLDFVYHKALVTYPAYHYLEIFDIETGQTISSNAEIRYPFDCAIDPVSHNFWVTDSSGHLYKVDAAFAQETLVSDVVQKPTQIKISSDKQIYVLDIGSKRIFDFNLDGTLMRSIPRIGDYDLINPKFIEISPIDPELYIIDHTDTDNVLYRFFTEENTAELIYREEGIRTIRIDPNDRSIWLSINTGTNSKIVQLSYEGIRLKLLEGFSYIVDFQIISITETLVIADSKESVVTHMRPDSTIIGKYSGAAYPYKVYNE